MGSPDADVVQAAVDTPRDAAAVVDIAESTPTTLSRMTFDALTVHHKLGDLDLDLG